MIKHWSEVQIYQLNENEDIDALLAITQFRMIEEEERGSFDKQKDSLH